MQSDIQHLLPTASCKLAVIPILIQSCNMAKNPLSHLLQSNAVPSPIEESGIRHALIQIDSSIAALEDEVMKTRLILFEMEKKRKLAAEEQATHLGVLSAVRRFPLEIIGEILWFALPEKLDKSGQFELLRLSTVSGSWRNAAFSTHKLWAVLDINIDLYVQYVESIGTEKFLMDGLCRWVERSGSLPLNLSIQQRTSRAGGLFLQVIQRLPAKHRWKEITLQGYNSLFAFLFHGDHQMPRDSLELLNASTWNINDNLTSQESPLPEQPPISLQNAANLKRLKLQLSESEPLSAGFLLVPWAQLTELKLFACMPLTNYLTILKECQNLEVCEFGLMDHNHDFDPNQLPLLPLRLVLPKIRRLGMWRCYYRQIGPFLLSPELPNINDLCIQEEDYESEGPLITDIILNFIDFSKCEILKLELQWIRDDDSELFRLLFNMKSLTELRITSGGINGSLFDSLRASYGLNNLEVLDITVGLIAATFDPTRLAEFVEHCHKSRQSTGKLKSVSLNYYGTLPDQTLYRRLEKKGVTFDITRL